MTLYPLNEHPADPPGRDKEEPKPATEYVRESEDRWQCGECPKTFEDFGLLTAHLMHDHDPED